VNEIPQEQPIIKKIPQNLKIAIISAVLIPIIQHIVDSLLKKSYINISITIVSPTSSTYPAMWADLLILLFLLMLNEKINSIRDEIEYLNYKLYSARRRLR
jgi:hypothetical protein